jgi:hypothetical protein
VALIGLTRANLGLGRLQSIIVAVGLATANSIALHVNMRRYTTGVDIQNFNLNSPIEWWWNVPVTPMVVWAAGSAAFAVVLAVLTWYAWETRGPVDDHPELESQAPVSSDA